MKVFKFQQFTNKYLLNLISLEIVGKRSIFFLKKKQLNLGNKQVKNWEFSEERSWKTGIS